MTSSPYPTKARIREIFAHLTAGDAPTFYTHVADDVDWTIMGSHALSGHYSDKATLMSKALSRIGSLFDSPMKLRITGVIGGEVEEWAVVEMAADGICKNGKLPLPLPLPHCPARYSTISSAGGQQILPPTAEIPLSMNYMRVDVRGSGIREYLLVVDAVARRQDCSSASVSGRSALKPCFGGK
ncbi:hypothetical protein F4813DRAFT_385455 [Daldinia decipiens]|uniref:uncharacterized protein n=1 Tax=Daldinia decipiens TaxID=326647 RepID=UPI0020C3F7CE|nr:uncharacterized protein F4813DRAFT_385455 [Daldinia decipiens]KAI1661783.1 hypothetical protein F4813DRAFT_385455 [Daldinia decipiens]